MNKKKHLSLEAKKARYGYIFIAPWVLGMILLFLFPIVQSVIYSFSDVVFLNEGLTLNFIGLENYKFALYEDPNYINNFMKALTELVTTVPFVLVVSLIIAILLNNKFPGRLFFRSMYFIPVIIANGLALELFLKASSGETGEIAVSDAVAFGMFDFTEVLRGLNLPTQISGYLETALGNLFMLVWQSGIQIILFIAGLQSIPDLLYEVADVEGATKWEAFWFITLPMLLRTILLVFIFTVIEVITSTTNAVMKQGYNFITLLKYGTGTSMLWLYFAVIGVILAVFLLIYNKMLKRWG